MFSGLIFLCISTNLERPEITLKIMNLLQRILMYEELMGSYNHTEKTCE